MATRGTTGTKQRLLEAAGEVFAEKGYRDATIAEISKRADANIAAVNYHFGSKDRLYVEAWRSAFGAGLGRHPPDGGLNGNAPPEDRLRARMAALIRRVLDGDTREFEIMRREMGDPTGLLDEAHHQSIEPLRRETLRLVGELLGPRASAGQVALGMMTVMSPIFHAMQRIWHRRKLAKHRPPDPHLLAIRDVESFISHTLRFVLAGLRAMREGIEAGDWPDMELPDEFMQTSKASRHG